MFRLVIYRRQRARFPRPVAPSGPQQAPPTHIPPATTIHIHTTLEHLRFLRGSPRDRSPRTQQGNTAGWLRARQQVGHDLPLPAGGRQPTVGGPIGRRPSSAAHSSPSGSGRLGQAQCPMRRNSSALSHFLFPHPPPYLIPYACSPPWGSSRSDCAAPTRR